MQDLKIIKICLLQEQNNLIKILNVNNEKEINFKKKSQKMSKR